jgi:hypothetical protein
LFVIAYVYRWSLRPEAGLTLELRVTAPSVVVARREIRRFLVAHDGVSWAIDCVTRETTRGRYAPRTLLLARRG